MKKLIAFFIGFFLVLLSFVALFLMSIIFNGSDKVQIKSYIFQPALRSYERFSNLQAAKDINPTKLRDILVQKYVTEYFYVLPLEQNIKNRTSLQTAPLRYISTRTVFDSWLKTQAKTIEQMTTEKQFRTVEFPVNAIYVEDVPNKPNIKKYTIKYITKTWPATNSIADNNQPIVEYKLLRLEALFTPDLKKETTSKKLKKDLNSGKDPVSLFNFVVTAIERPE